MSERERMREREGVDRGGTREREETGRERERETNSQ